jgi:hypothetical protein
VLCRYGSIQRTFSSTIARTRASRERFFPQFIPSPAEGAKMTIGVIFLDLFNKCLRYLLRLRILAAAQTFEGLSRRK